MLEVHNLSFAYGERRVLDGLTFHLQAGEVLGLLGPNGAGKSTLMALITGLLSPLEGTVRVAGGDPRQAGTRTRLGLVPQELGLYEELSARENLRFFARILGLGGRELNHRVDALLEEVGLRERARERVGTFSGGMKRRLNLASALLHNPSLLLLDEATVGVDPQSRLALYELVLRQRQAGRAVLYATHLMEEAQRLCDRVAVMDQGRLLALDTVPRLLQQHGGATRICVVRGGVPVEVETQDPLAELARQQAQGALDAFSLKAPDLERVFLKLTGHELRD